MPPFSYAVPERRNVGFLKLLVSTRPIHSTAGTWPCLCRFESDGPSTLDGGEYWGTLTIPMIQRRVSSVPPPTFPHLAPYFFLGHYAISTFQIYRKRHLFETELDAISPHLILSMPFLLRFRFYFPSLLISFVQISVSIGFSLINKSPVFNFEFLFIFCMLDICVIIYVHPDPSLERTLPLRVHEKSNNTR